MIQKSYNELKEGMVTADDIRDASGRLLVAKGTELSEPLISRLTKIKYSPEYLATRNSLLESATQSQNPMKLLRFNLSSKRLKYHYLSKYECPEEVLLMVKRRLIGNTLSCACRAVDFNVARKEFEGGRISLKNRLFYFGSKNKFNSSLVGFIRAAFLKLKEPLRRDWFRRTKNVQSAGD